MTSKSKLIQIRVSPEEKALIQARVPVGMDMSPWVLSELLQKPKQRLTAATIQAQRAAFDRAHIARILESLAARIADLSEAERREWLEVLMHLRDVLTNPPSTNRLCSRSR
jgi:hypothetical protein